MSHIRDPNKQFFFYVSYLDVELVRQRGEDVEQGRGEVTCKHWLKHWLRGIEVCSGK